MSTAITVIPKPSRIKRENYKGVLVTSMVRALKSREINRHLMLNEKNVVDIIFNDYKTNGFIGSEQMNTIYILYHNFVMWGHRHTSTIVKETK